MREYKFRGKRIDNGEWVYGYLFIDKQMTDRVFILKELSHDENDEFSDKRFFMIRGYEVHPESVGQYINVKDKNEIDIYEGDILKRKDSPNAVVIWPPEIYGILIGVYVKKSSEYKYDMETFEKLPTEVRRFIGDEDEVIGNITDNSELLIAEAK